MKRVRILVADGQPLLRRGVRSLLGTRRGWKIVGEAASSAEALAKSKRLRPDVVIVDIALRAAGGLDTTREILAACPGTAAVILTSGDCEDVIREVLAAGARACASKSNSEREVLAAVRAVVARSPFFSPGGARPAPEDGPALAAASVDGGRQPLSRRQREVVRLVAEGRSNKEIASELGISVRTAETHRASATRRLKLSSLGELVRYAVRSGLVKG